MRFFKSILLAMLLMSYAFASTGPSSDKTTLINDLITNHTQQKEMEQNIEKMIQSLSANPQITKEKQDEIRSRVQTILKESKTKTAKTLENFSIDELKEIQEFNKNQAVIKFAQIKFNQATLKNLDQFDVTKMDKTRLEKINQLNATLKMKNIMTDGLDLFFNLQKDMLKKQAQKMGMDDKQLVEEFERGKKQALSTIEKQLILSYDKLSLQELSELNKIYTNKTMNKYNTSMNKLSFETGAKMFEVGNLLFN